LAGEQWQWERARCSQDDCIGIELPSTTWCLGHAAKEAPIAFDAELKRIRTNGKVDARGVVISGYLLERLLDVVPRKHDRPILTAAQFDGATFQGEARFNNAIFEGQTRFFGTTFEGKAGFNMARFTGEAVFNGATFQRVADFIAARFEREARFPGATFHSEAGFGRATFEREAVFNEATFERETRFAGAVFQDRALFKEASFQRPREFGPLLAKQLILEDAVFGERVQLEATVAKLSAQRAQFPAGVYLRLRYASVDLDDANLAVRAILAGEPSPSSRLEKEEQQLAGS
jgi:uncharacterized protein YjbI with pentapeptide repeats